ncbi:MAG: DegV family protein [Oscillospiraceae bacterium]|jgi:DegV family protein with EDD domain|nr:DegV family protein [Oscillospiraceae bacterium]
MNYIILTDSTTDLSPALVKEMDVVVLPMVFTIDGASYRNDPEESQLSCKAFYDLLREEKTATTSQITVAEFESAVKPYLQDGVDVLYLAFSSGLSGTYNSARLAFESLREKYPERKLLCVDTLAASMGEGLLVYYAAMQRKAGKSIDAVAAWVRENRLRLCHWFTVDDLHHLKRGGRVSGAAALVGTMLGIKPVLHVDDEGHLTPMEKVRGRKASLDALCNHMQDTCENPSEQTVFISHGDCLADGKYVADEVKRRFGVKKVYINSIGPVIGSHSGPGTIALFFLGSKR